MVVGAASFTIHGDVDDATGVRRADQVGRDEASRLRRYANQAHI